MSFVVHYREELPPSVATELDDFYARLNTFLNKSFNDDGSLKIASSSSASSVASGDSIMQQVEDSEGHWWKNGPWIFDTDHSHDAIQVTSNLSGTINNFAYGDIDKAVGLELNLHANTTLTGIKAPPQTLRRVLILRNNSSTFTITLKNQNTGSQEINRFSLPNDLDIVLGTRQTAWLYYDADNHRWGSFITGNNSGGLFGAGSTLSTGDVTGPGVAADGDIVLFDGTTGKLIKDSGTTLASITSGVVLEGTLVITDAQIKTLNSAPITLVAAAPGKIIMPIMLTMEKGPWTNAYSANPSLSLRWAGIATDLVSSFGSSFGGTGFAGAAGMNNSPSWTTSGVGKALQLRSTADIASVGSTVGNTASFRYVYYII